MNHAENPMSDSVNQARAFEVLTATPVLSRRKPRDWPDDEKARLIAETLLPGANVSAIARAAGLDPSQLYGWRRKTMISGSVVPRAEVANEKQPDPWLDEDVRSHRPQSYTPLNLLIK
jgi:transposase